MSRFSNENETFEKKKDCKACFDFKDWLKDKNKESKKEEREEKNNKRQNCPLYRDELGRSTWGLLHTMAAYYPEKPNEKEEKQMENFIDGLATFFPCEECSSDFQEEIKKNPPQVKSRYDLSKWFCEQHNAVNRKLDKPEFDCSKVFERWKDGWKDGSCEYSNTK